MVHPSEVIDYSHHYPILKRVRAYYDTVSNDFGAYFEVDGYPRFDPRSPEKNLILSCYMKPDDLKALHVALGRVVKELGRERGTP